MQFRFNTLGLFDRDPAGINVPVRISGNRSRKKQIFELELTLLSIQLKADLRQIDAHWIHNSAYKLGKGYDFVLAKFQIKLLSLISGQNQSWKLGTANFRTFHEGLLCRNPLMHYMFRKDLNVELLSGTQYTGSCVLVAPKRCSPLINFSYTGTDECWFQEG